MCWQWTGLARVLHILCCSIPPCHTDKLKLYYFFLFLVDLMTFLAWLLYCARTRPNWTLIKVTLIAFKNLLKRVWRNTSLTHETPYLPDGNFAGRLLPLFIVFMCKTTCKSAVTNIRMGTEGLQEEAFGNRLVLVTFICTFGSARQRSTRSNIGTWDLVCTHTTLAHRALLHTWRNSLSLPEWL